MPKLRLGEILCDKLQDEANGDGYVLAKQIGLPSGWFASATQRSGQESWDLKFVSPNGFNLRSLKQIFEALGGNDMVPDFLRPFAIPALPPLGGAAAKPAAKPSAASVPAPTVSERPKRPAPETVAELQRPAQAARLSTGTVPKVVEPPEDPAAEEAELAKLEEAGARDQADGYAIIRREVRQGGSRESFLVLPDNVLCIDDLDVLAGKIVASGWQSRDGSAAASSGKARTFTGKWDLTLYADRGRLLVRSPDRGVVGRIARLYTDSWLLA